MPRGGEVSGQDGYQAVIPGFTSTGSKRPEALYGHLAGGPRRMVRASGCRVWDDEGREYLDTVMGLGTVALGYGHPAVAAAVEAAARDGVVGPLPPTHEVELAGRLVPLIPGAEAVRFLKTGAEAVSAAIRIARVHTNRELIVTCGYHGWLDSFQEGDGIPESVRRLRREIPFDDVPALRRTVDEFQPLAAIVVEPVIDAAPSIEWLQALRKTATATGAVLVFDEIKTSFRLAIGGVAERFGVVPDLMVLGKALGNGLPIAAVCGPAGLMQAAERTWISSTLATEYVSLAAARAVIDVFESEKVTEHLARVGAQFHALLTDLAARYPNVVTEVKGLPEMCYLSAGDEHTGSSIAVKAAAHGLIFKRSAYNFVALAHTDSILAEIAERLDAALDEVERTC